MVRMMLSVILCIFLGFGPEVSYAQGLMAQPGVATVYMPLMIKGMTVHADNPVLFDFIVNTGNSGIRIDSPVFKDESRKLIKYFLAALTIKETDMWVNLSPYEKDRMLSADLGQTAMGQDMLAQDFVLKQLTASFMNPEKELGRKFWDRIYSEAQSKFGTSDIPVDTFNKVWIMADKAKVFERDGSAYVVTAHLKVMLEADFVAASHQKNAAEPSAPAGVVADDPQTELSKSLIRQIILPAIEREVNEAASFASLRQMFHSMILATWYKKALKDALLNQVYADKGKTGGVLTSDVKATEKIFEQYLTAYRTGAVNLIKEEADPVTGEVTPRKYFSGGVVGRFDLAMADPNDPDVGRGLSLPGQNARLLTKMDLAQMPVESAKILEIGKDFTARSLIEVIKALYLEDKDAMVAIGSRLFFNGPSVRVVQLTANRELAFYDAGDALVLKVQLPWYIYRTSQTAEKVWASIEPAVLKGLEDYAELKRVTILAVPGGMALIDVIEAIQTMYVEDKARMVRTNSRLFLRSGGVFQEVFLNSSGVLNIIDRHSEELIVRAQVDPEIYDEVISAGKVWELIQAGVLNALNALATDVAQKNNILEMRTPDLEWLLAMVASMRSGDLTGFVDVGSTLWLEGGEKWDLALTADGVLSFVRRGKVRPLFRIKVDPYLYRGQRAVEAWQSIQMEVLQSLRAYQKIISAPDLVERKQAKVFVKDYKGDAAQLNGLQVTSKETSLKNVDLMELIGSLKIRQMRAGDPFPELSLLDKEGVQWGLALYGGGVVILSRHFMDNSRLTLRLDKDFPGIGQDPQEFLNLIKSGVIGGLSDKAQNEQTVMQGGIDLNGQAMGLDIEKSGRGITMTVDPAMADKLQKGDFTGLTPVIIKVTPMASLL